MAKDKRKYSFTFSASIEEIEALDEAAFMSGKSRSEFIIYLFDTWRELQDQINEWLEDQAKEN